jgi:hypothetical protein
MGLGSEGAGARLVTVSSLICFTWIATCRNEDKAAALDVKQPVKDENEEEVKDVIGTASSLILNSLDAEMSTDGEEKQSSPLVALGALLGGILLLAGGGYLLRDQIQSFLEFFIGAVEDWGSWGYVAYALTYTALEVLAVPAIPLTMTAGTQNPESSV